MGRTTESAEPRPDIQFQIRPNTLIHLMNPFLFSQPCSSDRHPPNDVSSVHYSHNRMDVLYVMTYILRFDDVYQT